MQIETRQITSEITLEYRGNTPVIKGLASPVYNGSPETEYQLDTNVVERFAPGAFDTYLATNPDVYAFAEHNEDKLLGRTPETLSLQADAKGLRYEIVGDDTTEFKDAAQKVKSRKYRGSSIGFSVDKVEWIKDGSKDVRLIKQAKLHHISPVVNPAYKATQTEYAMRELQLCKNRELHELYEKKLQELLNSLSSQVA